MRCDRATGLLAAALLSLLPAAQANDCKIPPPAKLSPAPEQGVVHSGRPHYQVLSRQGNVLITADGWDYTTMLRGSMESDGRLIVWDTATFKPRHVFTHPARQVPPIPGAMPRSGPVHTPPGLGFFPFSVSADGRYLAFSLGQPGNQCVDVYEGDRHLARYPDRLILTFWGDRLLLGEVDDRRITGIYLQPPGEKLVKKSLDMLASGKRQKFVNQVAGIFADAAGNAVVGTRTFRAGSGTGTIPGVVELGAWQAQPHQLFAGQVDGNSGVRIDYRHSARGDDYQLFFQASRLHDKVERVPLPLRISRSVIEHDSQITGKVTSDSTVLVLWRTDGQRDRSGKDRYYGQVFFSDTGLPVHPIPLVLPGWERNPQAPPHALMLDDEHLLLIPSAISFVQAEKINVFTGASTPVALLQTPADARRLVEAGEARRLELEAWQEAQRAREEQLNSIPVIRKVHEQGRAVDGYEAEVYCRLGGPRCTQVRLQVRSEMEARNRAAFAEQMRRARELHAPDYDIFYESRKRTECLRRRYNPTAIADPEFAGQSTGACSR